MRGILCTLLLSALSLCAADISGKWSGKWETSPDGGPGPHYMTLKQQGETVTGTAGPTADQQFDIKNGKFAEDKLTFDIGVVGGPTLRFEFKVDGDAMNGHATLDMNGQQQKLNLAVKRVKD